MQGKALAVAWMIPGQMGVVVVEAVHEEPVRHRRVAKGKPARMADDGRFAGVGGRRVSPGERLDCVERRPGEIEAVRGEGDADRIENEMAGPDPDLAGNFLVTQSACKFR